MIGRVGLSRVVYFVEFWNIIWSSGGKKGGAETLGCLWRYWRALALLHISLIGVFRLSELMYSVQDDLLACLNVLLACVFILRSKIKFSEDG